MRKPIALLIQGFLALILFLLPFRSNAFSVLTHEALIDANWEKVILPLLKEKYPRATKEELLKAKAFCYGGAVAPDMGYYPFGSKFFTNLVHYVRSGDFVVALLQQQNNLNEYAFALGSLSHYMADKYGHPLGINVSVPLVYPKLAKKFGSSVTYAEDKISHLRMEFGFDVLQTARGNYESQSYHNFIGFSVADTLLGKAFYSTYGLDIHDIFPNLKVAIGSFRWTVKSLFPVLTRAAWVNKRKEIRETTPGITGRKFMYRMQRRKYFEEYGREREKPGVRASILGFFIKILPKIGPLKALKFKTPGPASEKLFIGSFDTVLTRYHDYVRRAPPGTLGLADIDFDTGEVTAPGEYPICDDTYADLLKKLEASQFSTASPALRKNIESFYSKARSEQKEEVKKSLEALHALKE